VVLGELGSSQSGTTWAAVRRLDDLRVVLKILPVTDATRAQAIAAQRISVLDQIGSEHLVRQHGAFVLADDTLALVTDEGTGGSLAQLLGARGPLTAGEAVTIVAPLLGALAALHAVGVVHGDLTPGNLTFSPDGKPLIADFSVTLLQGPYAGPHGGAGPGLGLGPGGSWRPSSSPEQRPRRLPMSTPWGRSAGSA